MSSTSSAAARRRASGDLQQAERKLEVVEQLGLVAAAGGAIEPPSGIGQGEVHACGRGQLDRGFRPQGAIQVLVQLGLGQPAQCFDQLPVVLGHRGMIGAT